MLAPPAAQKPDPAPRRHPHLAEVRHRDFGAGGSVGLQPIALGQPSPLADRARADRRCALEPRHGQCHAVAADGIEAGGQRQGDGRGHSHAGRPPREVRERNRKRSRSVARRGKDALQPFHRGVRLAVSIPQIVVAHVLT